MFAKAGTLELSSWDMRCTSRCASDIVVTTYIIGGVALSGDIATNG